MWFINFWGQIWMLFQQNSIKQYGLYTKYMYVCIYCLIKGYENSYAFMFKYCKCVCMCYNMSTIFFGYTFINAMTAKWENIKKNIIKYRIHIFMNKYGVTIEHMTNGHNLFIANRIVGGGGIDDGH